MGIAEEKVFRVTVKVTKRPRAEEYRSMVRYLVYIIYLYMLGRDLRKISRGHIPTYSMFVVATSHSEYVKSTCVNPALYTVVVTRNVPFISVATAVTA